MQERLVMSIIGCLLYPVAVVFRWTAFVFALKLSHPRVDKLLTAFYKRTVNSSKEHLIKINCWDDFDAYVKPIFSKCLRILEKLSDLYVSVDSFISIYIYPNLPGPGLCWMLIVNLQLGLLAWILGILHVLTKYSDPVLWGLEVIIWKRLAKTLSSAVLFGLIGALLLSPWWSLFLLPPLVFVYYRWLCQVREL